MSDVITNKIGYKLLEDFQAKVRANKLSEAYFLVQEKFMEIPPYMNMTADGKQVQVMYEHNAMTSMLFTAVAYRKESNTGNTVKELLTCIVPLLEMKLTAGNQDDANKFTTAQNEKKEYQIKEWQKVCMGVVLVNGVIE